MVPNGDSISIYESTQTIYTTSTPNIDQLNFPNRFFHPASWEKSGPTNSHKIANNHNQIDTYDLTPYVNLIEYTDANNNTLLSNNHSSNSNLNKTRLRYRNSLNDSDPNGEDGKFDDWNHNGVRVNLVDNNKQRDIKYVSSIDGKLDSTLIEKYLNYLDNSKYIQSDTQANTISNTQLAGSRLAGSNKKWPLQCQDMTSEFNISEYPINIGKNYYPPTTHKIETGLVIPTLESLHSVDNRPIQIYTEDGGKKKQYRDGEVRYLLSVTDFSKNLSLKVSQHNINTRTIIFDNIPTNMKGATSIDLYLNGHKLVANRGADDLTYVYESLPDTLTDVSNITSQSYVTVVETSTQDIYDMPVSRKMRFPFDDADIYRPNQNSTFQEWEDWRKRSIKTENSYDSKLNPTPDPGTDIANFLTAIREISSFDYNILDSDMDSIYVWNDNEDWVGETNIEECIVKINNYWLPSTREPGMKSDAYDVSGVNVFDQSGNQLFDPSGSPVLDQSGNQVLDQSGNPVFDPSGSPLTTTQSYPAIDTLYDWKTFQSDPSNNRRVGMLHDPVGLDKWGQIVNSDNGNIVVVGCQIRGEVAMTSQMDSSGSGFIDSSITTLGKNDPSGTTFLENNAIDMPTYYKIQTETPFNKLLLDRNDPSGSTLIRARPVFDKIFNSTGNILQNTGKGTDSMVNRQLSTNLFNTFSTQSNMNCLYTGYRSRYYGKDENDTYFMNTYDMNFNSILSGSETQYSHELSTLDTVNDFSMAGILRIDYNNGDTSMNHTLITESSEAPDIVLKITNSENNCQVVHTENFTNGSILDSSNNFDFSIEWSNYNITQKSTFEISLIYSYKDSNDNSFHNHIVNYTQNSSKPSLYDSDNIIQLDRVSSSDIDKLVPKNIYIRVSIDLLKVYQAPEQYLFKHGNNNMADASGVDNYYNDYFWGSNSKYSGTGERQSRINCYGVADFRSNLREATGETKLTSRSLNRGLHMDNFTTNRFVDTYSEKRITRVDLRVRPDDVNTSEVVNQFGTQFLFSGIEDANLDNVNGDHTGYQSITQTLLDASGNDASGVDISGCNVSGIFTRNAHSATSSDEPNWAEGINNFVGYRNDNSVAADWQFTSVRLNSDLTSVDTWRKSQINLANGIDISGNITLDNTSNVHTHDGFKVKLEDPSTLSGQYYKTYIKIVPGHMQFNKSNACDPVPTNVTENCFMSFNKISNEHLTTADMSDIDTLGYGRLRTDLWKTGTEQENCQINELINSHRILTSLSDSNNEIVNTDSSNTRLMDDSEYYYGMLPNTTTFTIKDSSQNGGKFEHVSSYDNTSTLDKLVITNMKTNSDFSNSSQSNIVGVYRSPLDAQGMALKYDDNSYSDEIFMMNSINKIKITGSTLPTLVKKVGDNWNNQSSVNNRGQLFTVEVKESDKSTIVRDTWLTESNNLWKHTNIETDTVTDCGTETTFDGLMFKIFPEDLGQYNNNVLENASQIPVDIKRSRMVCNDMVVKLDENGNAKRTNIHEDNKIKLSSYNLFSGVYTKYDTNSEDIVQSVSFERGDGNTTNHNSFLVSNVKTSTGTYDINSGETKSSIFGKSLYGTTEYICDALIEYRDDHLDISGNEDVFNDSATNLPQYVGLNQKSDHATKNYSYRFSLLPRTDNTETNVVPVIYRNNKISKAGAPARPRLLDAGYIFNESDLSVPSHNNLIEISGRSFNLDSSGGLVQSDVLSGDSIVCGSGFDNIFLDSATGTTQYDYVEVSRIEYVYRFDINSDVHPRGQANNTEIPVFNISSSDKTLHGFKPKDVEIISQYNNTVSGQSLSKVWNNKLGNLLTSNNYPWNDVSSKNQLLYREHISDTTPIRIGTNATLKFTHQLDNFPGYTNNELLSVLETAQTDATVLNTTSTENEPHKLENNKTYEITGKNRGDYYLKSTSGDNIQVIFGENIDKSGLSISKKSYDSSGILGSWTEESLSEGSLTDFIFSRDMIKISFSSQSSSTKLQLRVVSTVTPLKVVTEPVPVVMEISDLIPSTSLTTVDSTDGSNIHKVVIQKGTFTFTENYTQAGMPRSNSNPVALPSSTGKALNNYITKTKNYQKMADCLSNVDASSNISNSDPNTPGNLDYILDCLDLDCDTTSITNLEPDADPSNPTTPSGKLHATLVELKQKLNNVLTTIGEYNNDIYIGYVVTCESDNSTDNVDDMRLRWTISRDKLAIQCCDASGEGSIHIIDINSSLFGFDQARLDNPHSNVVFRQNLDNSMINNDRIEDSSGNALEYDITTGLLAGVESESIKLPVPKIELTGPNGSLKNDKYVGVMRYKKLNGMDLCVQVSVVDTVEMTTDSSGANTYEMTDRSKVLAQGRGPMLIYDHQNSFDQNHEFCNRALHQWAFDSYDVNPTLTTPFDLQVSSPVSYEGYNEADASQDYYHKDFVTSTNFKYYNVRKHRNVDSVTSGNLYINLFTVDDNTSERLLLGDNTLQNENILENTNNYAGSIPVFMYDNIYYRYYWDVEVTDGRYYVTVDKTKFKIYDPNTTVTSPDPDHITYDEMQSVFNFGDCNNPNIIEKLTHQVKNNGVLVKEKKTDVYVVKPTYTYDNTDHTTTARFSLTSERTLKYQDVSGEIVDTSNGNIGDVIVDTNTWNGADQEILHFDVVLKGTPTNSTDSSRAFVQRLEGDNHYRYITPILRTPHAVVTRCDLKEVDTLTGNTDDNNPPSKSKVGGNEQTIWTPIELSGVDHTYITMKKPEHTELDNDGFYIKVHNTRAHGIKYYNNTDEINIHNNPNTDLNGWFSDSESQRMITVSGYNRDILTNNNIRPWSTSFNTLSQNIKIALEHNSSAYDANGSVDLNNFVSRPISLATARKVNVQKEILGGGFTNDTSRGNAPKSYNVTTKIYQCDASGAANLVMLPNSINANTGDLIKLYYNYDEQINECGTVGDCTEPSNSDLNNYGVIYKLTQYDSSGCSDVQKEWVYAKKHDSGVVESHNVTAPTGQSFFKLTQFANNNDVDLRNNEELKPLTRITDAANISNTNELLSKRYSGVVTTIKSVNRDASGGFNEIYDKIVGTDFGDQTITLERPYTNNSSNAVLDDLNPVNAPHGLPDLSTVSIEYISKNSIVEDIGLILTIGGVNGTVSSYNSGNVAIRGFGSYDHEGSSTSEGVGPQRFTYAFDKWQRSNRFTSGRVTDSNSNTVTGVTKQNDTSSSTITNVLELVNPELYPEGHDTEKNMRPKMYGVASNNSSNSANISTLCTDGVEYFFRPMNITTVQRTAGSDQDTTKLDLRYNVWEHNWQQAIKQDETSSPTIGNEYTTYSGLNVESDSNAQDSTKRGKLNPRHVYLPENRSFSVTAVQENDDWVNETVKHSNQHRIKELFILNSVTNNPLCNTSNLKPESVTQHHNNTHDVWTINNTLSTASNQMTFTYQSDEVHANHINRTHITGGTVDYSCMPLPLDRCSNGWETRWKIDNETKDFNHYGSGVDFDSNGALVVPTVAAGSNTELNSRYGDNQKWLYNNISILKRRGQNYFPQGKASSTKDNVVGVLNNTKTALPYWCIKAPEVEWRTHERTFTSQDTYEDIPNDASSWNPLNKAYTWFEHEERNQISDSNVSVPDGRPTVYKYFIPDLYTVFTTSSKLDSEMINANSHEVNVNVNNDTISITNNDDYPKPKIETIVGSVFDNSAIHRNEAQKFKQIETSGTTKIVETNNSLITNPTSDRYPILYHSNNRTDGLIANHSSILPEGLYWAQFITTNPKKFSLYHNESGGNSINLTHGSVNYDSFSLLKSDNYSLEETLGCIKSSNTLDSSLETPELVASRIYRHNKMITDSSSINTINMNNWLANSKTNRLRCTFRVTIPDPNGGDDQVEDRVVYGYYPRIINDNKYIQLEHPEHIKDVFPAGICDPSGVSLNYCYVFNKIEVLVSKESSAQISSDQWNELEWLKFGTVFGENHVHGSLRCRFAYRLNSRLPNIVGDKIIGLKSVNRFNLIGNELVCSMWQNVRTVTGVSRNSDGSDEDNREFNSSALFDDENKQYGFGKTVVSNNDRNFKEKTIPSNTRVQEYVYISNDAVDANGETPEVTMAVNSNEIISVDKSNWECYAVSGYLQIKKKLQTAGPNVGKIVYSEEYINPRINYGLYLDKNKNLLTGGFNHQNAPLDLIPSIFKLEEKRIATFKDPAQNWLITDYGTEYGYIKDTFGNSSKTLPSDYEKYLGIKFKLNSSFDSRAGALYLVDSFSLRNETHWNNIDLTIRSSNVDGLEISNISEGSVTHNTIYGTKSYSTMVVNNPILEYSSTELTVKIQDDSNIYPENVNILNIPNSLDNSNGDINSMYCRWSWLSSRGLNRYYRDVVSQRSRENKSNYGNKTFMILLVEACKQAARKYTNDSNTELANLYKGLARHYSKNSTLYSSRDIKQILSNDLETDINQLWPNETTGTTNKLGGIKLSTLKTENAIDLSLYVKLIEMYNATTNMEHSVYHKGEVNNLNTLGTSYTTHANLGDAPIKDIDTSVNLNIQTELPVSIEQLQMAPSLENRLDEIEYKLENRITNVEQGFNQFDSIKNYLSTEITNIQNNEINSTQKISEQFNEFKTYIDKEISTISNSDTVKEVLKQELSVLQNNNLDVKISVLEQQIYDVLNKFNSEPYLKSLSDKINNVESQIINIQNGKQELISELMNIENTSENNRLTQLSSRIETLETQLNNLVTQLNAQKTTSDDINEMNAIKQEVTLIRDEITNSGQKLKKLLKKGGISLK